MKLNDCTPGDLVVIVWPEGAPDYSRGRFSDYALGGLETFVIYSGPSGKPPKRRKGERRKPGEPEPQPENAYVNVANPETGEPYRKAFAAVANVEVIEVVETAMGKRRYRPWRWWNMTRTNDGWVRVPPGELSLDTAGDVDPIAAKWASVRSQQ
jgi:hypothetical protein